MVCGERLKSIIILVVLLYLATAEGARGGRQKQCAGSSSGDLLLGELKVNTALLNGFDCQHWRLDGLAGTPCDPAAADTEPSFIRVEFWRGEGDFTPTQYDAPGEEIENVFVVVSREPVTGSVVQSGSSSNGPVYSFKPRLDEDDVFIDEAAVVNNRPYHSVLAPSRLKDMNVDDGWYVNIMYMQMGELVPSIQSYAINVTCMAQNVTQQPCPRTSPSMANACNGKGKCVALKQDVAEGWPQPSACSCADGWGDYACNRKIPALTDNQTVEVLPLSWSYWTIKFDGSDIGSSQLLVEMVRDASASGMPLLCLKPIMPADDGSDTTDLPNRNYVNITHCDVTSYSLVQNQHFMMLTYDSVKYKKYYISVWNLNNEAKAVVKLTSHWVDLKGPRKGAFMCPFGCYGNGNCSDTAQANVPEMRIRSQTPFNCSCKPDYGGVMCEGPLTPVYLTNSSSRTVNLKQSTLPPGAWHYYPVYVNPQRFGNKAEDLVQGVWQVTTSDGIERSSLVMFTYNQYPRLVLDPSNPQLIDELRKEPVFFPPYATGGRATQRFQLRLFPSAIASFVSTGGMIAMLAINNRDFQSSHEVSYMLQLSAARNVASLPQPYMDIVLGVAAFLMLVLVLTLCKRIVATQLARRFGRRLGQAGGAGSGIGRVKGVPTSISSNFPTYLWPRKKEENKDNSTNGNKQASLQASETTLPGAVMSDSPPGTTQASPMTHHVVPDPSTSISTAHVQIGTAVPSAAAAAVVADVEMGHAAVAPDQDKDQTPEDCCAICLCEYEVGEMLRQLPCHHDFHCECVDKWMTEHDTCPICRMLLVPNPDDPSPGRDQRSEFIPSGPGSSIPSQQTLPHSNSTRWVMNGGAAQSPVAPSRAARMVTWLGSLAPSRRFSSIQLGPRRGAHQGGRVLDSSTNLQSHMDTSVASTELTPAAAQAPGADEAGGVTTHTQVVEIPGVVAAPPQWPHNSSALSLAPTLAPPGLAGHTTASYSDPLRGSLTTSTDYGRAAPPGAALSAPVWSSPLVQATHTSQPATTLSRAPSSPTVQQRSLAMIGSGDATSVTHAPEAVDMAKSAVQQPAALEGLLRLQDLAGWQPSMGGRPEGAAAMGTGDGGRSAVQQPTASERESGAPGGAVSRSTVLQPATGERLSGGSVMETVAVSRSMVLPAASERVSDSSVQEARTVSRSMVLPTRERVSDASVQETVAVSRSTELQNDSGERASDGASAPTVIHIPQPVPSDPSTDLERTETRPAGSNSTETANL